MWERGLKLDKHSTRKEKCINEEKRDKPEKTFPRRNREPEQIMLDLNAYCERIKLKTHQS